MNSFQFDHVILKPEEQIGQHSQPTWELDYIIRGHGYKSIGNSVPLPFRDGEVVLLHPNIEHEWSFEDVTTIENITVIFSDQWLTKIASDFPELLTIKESLLKLPPAVTFNERLRIKVADYLKRMITQSPSTRMLSLLQIMLIISESNDFQAIATSFNETLTKQRIRKIDLFIRCNYARNITLDDIATHIGMNHSSLCSLYKRVTGKTIIEHLTTIRITQAKYLLNNTDSTIKEISYAVGYSDLPHFSRVFHREVGVSPKEYRSKNNTPSSSTVIDKIFKL